MPAQWIKSCKIGDLKATNSFCCENGHLRTWRTRLAHGVLNTFARGSINYRNSDGFPTVDAPKSAPTFGQLILNGGFRGWTLATDGIMLLSGVLLYPITCDEFHKQVELGSTVWTGTDSGGYASDMNVGSVPVFCDTWKGTADQDANAVVGSIGSRDFQWAGATEYGGTSAQSSAGPNVGGCGQNYERRLYCVEQ